MKPGNESLLRILQGGSLEDKLSGRGVLFDQLDWTSGSSPIPWQSAPGREGLLMPRKGGDASFPRLKELRSSENARGRLLHFFANHELLAIESMAYVLLRFPGADESFRRGVFRILQEEQQHLGAYLGRMKEYGVGFGEVPLNLYFWNSIRDMASPLEYAAQMSLTFEQANLDFALEFARLFENELQDPATAGLLEQVHRDEIRHVAHGWKWFQRWSRGEGRDDFERYRKALPFPMSPRRARGGRFFAEESRREAGLSEEFIRQIKIAGGSRGRVPSLYFFNPQCEVEEGWETLPVHLIRRIRDLEPLMLWLGVEEDCIEQSVKPPVEFLERMHALRGFVPEILTTPEDFARHPVFEEFRPWGFSRSAWTHLDTLQSEWRSPPRFPRGLHRDFLFSKAWWKRVLGGPGTVLDSESGVDAWLEEVRASTAAVIIKSDRGTSGRGHLKLEPGFAEDPALRKKLLQRVLREGALVVEPYFSKVADFSVQYEILPGGKTIEFEPRIFLTDKHFQYQGAVLGRGDAPGIPAMDCILREEARWRAIHRKALEHLSGLGYAGPLGFDALVARTRDGRLEVVPVIEVNVRLTMGRVALEIEKAARRKRPFRSGLWRFFGKQDLIRFSVKSFAELDHKFTVQYGDRYFPAQPWEKTCEVWSAVILDPTEEETDQSWGFSAT